MYRHYLFQQEGRAVAESLRLTLGQCSE